MLRIHVRNERPEDRRAVEELTKKAFWNVNVPGCDEHYLVHVLREHADFVPALDLVAEADGRLIGNLMAAKGRLLDEAGESREVLSFGPLSVHPAYQRRGVGKRLLAEGFRRAEALGFDAIVIFGNPDNYTARGFESCLKHRIYIGDHIYPAAMLVKELKPGALRDGVERQYVESAAYHDLPADAEAFDRDFEPMEKGWAPTQEMFYILRHSTLRE